MSRRYPVADRYEEVERDYYRGGPRSTRDYEELDVELNRGSRDIDFLREDYGRSSAGQLVVRERDRPSPRSRSVGREDIVVRRNERDRYRREAERDEVDVSIRRQEGRTRRRPRESEQEEIIIEREDLRRPSRNVERDDVVIRRSESTRRPSRREVDYEIDIRRDDRDRGRVVDDREEVLIRTRSKSRPREVERDSEEVVIRRRGDSPRQRTDEEEVIIRHKERRDLPPPIIEPEPIIRPPIRQEIHQDIITHHRHIDHGVERARSRSPLPPLSSGRKVDETIEVDIRRRGRNGEIVDEDVIVESERRRGREEVEIRTRSRSISPHSAISNRRYRDDDFTEEAEYYNRKAMERAYIGEGQNGATREWAIIDVPPGTERVRMDGIGGGSQEITWQRYNGVRRSKFMVGDREYSSGYGLPEPRPELPLPLPPSRPSDMWTEITKDLVIKEALDTMGYPYEETEFFFYVMDYLKYEDVLQLVELSRDIRRERRRRLRDLEWERQEREAIAARDRRRYDDRIYEREIIIDRRR